MTVGEIETRMTSRELAEWEILDRTEPFGERRSDYHAALIAQHVVNIQLKPKDRKGIDAFLLRFERAESVPAEATPTDSAHSLMRKFKGITGNLKPANGGDNGNDRGFDRKTRVRR